MPEQSSDGIVVQHVQSTYFYNEQEIAHYSRLEVSMLRQLSDAGLLKGLNIAEEERRYSDEDLQLLRRIRRLNNDLGINLEGIEIILRLSARLDLLQHELTLYREQMEAKGE